MQDEDKHILISQKSDFTNPEKYLWISTKFVDNIYAGNMAIFKDRLCLADGPKNSPLFHPVPQFSVYPHSRDIITDKVVNIFQVIRYMRSEKLREITEKIQEAQKLGDVLMRRALKATKLPYITHTGIFNPRNNRDLKQPGFTFQLDIDKVSNPDDILNLLTHDKQLHVLFAAKSVSGNGVKAMLFLKDLMFTSDSWPWDMYRDAYHQVTPLLSEYFKKYYDVDIDSQMKAISQPFFLYYAPDLFIHKTLRPWI